MAAGFAGGRGTAEAPYLISTVDHLNEVRNYLDKHFRLIEDLDLGVYGTGQGWEPIGTPDIPFTGTFDGNGHTISNLFINRGDDSRIGLFGSVGVSGSILNLGLVNVNVRGIYYVGGLAGENYGQITGSYAVGAVEGGSSVGGCVGSNYYGHIEKSYATGTVKGKQAGGLVAVALGGTQPEDLLEIEEYLHRLGDFEKERVLLMPMSTDVTTMRLKAEWIVAYAQPRGYRYCPRMQLEWYGDRRGT